MTQPRVIEVFADVACPFTHVGLCRIVETRRALGRNDVVLYVRSWPLELVNGAPLDPALVAEEVADIRAQVAPDLFAGFRADRFPATSLPALGLAAAAYEVGYREGERVSLALRTLVFEEGVDVGRLDVITKLADQHALPAPVQPLDTTAVEADLAEGRARGVVGSPHFFTPAGDFFCPSLDIHRDESGQLHVATDPAAFETFLAACFA